MHIPFPQASLQLLTRTEASVGLSLIVVCCVWNYWLFSLFVNLNIIFIISPSISDCVKRQITVNNDHHNSDLLKTWDQFAGTLNRQKLLESRSSEFMVFLLNKNIFVMFFGSDFSSEQHTTKPVQSLFENISKIWTIWHVLSSHLFSFSACCIEVLFSKFAHY